MMLLLAMFYCLCLPECHCRKTKAMSDSNDNSSNNNDSSTGNINNKSVTMIIKATGRWPCCQVVKQSGTRHKAKGETNP